MIHPKINQITSEIIQWRRDFHKHPELGLEEFRTSKIIAKQLESFGLVVESGVGKTGIIGTLHGKNDGKTIALRADMDALPIQEKSNVPYKSVNNGIMHACGHDGHIAMLLGVAKILSQKKQNLSGNVKFIFQPAEEGFGGARLMIDDDALQRVDEIYGAHLWNVLPVGQISAQPGPIMAQAGKFGISILGKGGHGASPHESDDVIVALSHLILQMQTIVSRNTNPQESTVISVGKIHAGSNFNIIADQAYLEGTHRSFTLENFQMIKNRIMEIIAGIEKSFSVSINFEWTDGYPPTVNYAKQTQKINVIASKYANIENKIVSMGGEDFAYYLQQIPGCFFLIGSAPNSDDLTATPHHCSHFDFDEKAMLIGASIFVDLIESELG